MPAWVCHGEQAWSSFHVSLDRMLTIDNVHVVSMEIAICIPVVVSAFLVVLSSNICSRFRVSC
jgi:hypothetical protein